MTGKITIRSKPVEVSKVFCCPGCGGEVVLGDDNWQCRYCSRLGPVIEGVVGFADPDSGGRGSCGPGPDRYYTDWQLLFGDLGRARVLDLGGGADSFVLAGRCKEIMLVQGDLKRARFIENRRRHEGLSNMTLVHADINLLPFLPGQFDLVVCGGLWGQVGSHLTGSDLHNACIEFLTRMERLLAPGGNIMIDIENRFGARGSVNSCRRYQRLLVQAGFDLCETYRVPAECHDQAAVRPGLYRLRNGLWGSLLYWCRRGLAGLSPSRFFTSGFIIIAGLK